MKQLDSLTIAGISIKTTNQNHQSQIDISKLWERFFKENIHDQITNKINEKIYVVYTDYEGDYLNPYRVIIGFAVSEAPTSKQLFVKTIPASTYEVFHVSGKYPEYLIKAWQNIWQSDLDRSYAADLEIYPQNFNPNNAQLDILVSLKPKIST